MLTKTINQLKNQQTTVTPQAPSPGIDEATLRDILDRLANLENGLMDLRNEFSRWLKEF